jgi:hypothetical protein
MELMVKNNVIIKVTHNLYLTYLILLNRVLTQKSGSKEVNAPMGVAD